MALLAIVVMVALDPFTGVSEPSGGSPVVDEEAGRRVCVESFNAARAGGSSSGPVHVSHSLTGKACGVTGPGRGVWTTFDERTWHVNIDGWAQRREPNADLVGGRLVLRDP